MKLSKTVLVRVLGSSDLTVILFSRVTPPTNYYFARVPQALAGGNVRGRSTVKMGMHSSRSTSYATSVVAVGLPFIQVTPNNLRGKLATLQKLLASQYPDKML
jgi:hypothetical protein